MGISTATQSWKISRSSRAFDSARARYMARSPVLSNAAGFELSNPKLAGSRIGSPRRVVSIRSEEHTSELQSRLHLVCRLLLEKKKNQQRNQVQAVLVVATVARLSDAPSIYQ